MQAETEESNASELSHKRAEQVVVPLALLRSGSDELMRSGLTGWSAIAFARSCLLTFSLPKRYK